MAEATIDQLAAAVRDGATVIDVREPGEYVQGHVPGAVLVPMAIPRIRSERPVFDLRHGRERALEPRPEPARVTAPEE